MPKIDHYVIGDDIYEIVPEIAPLFNESDSYSVGDCVIKDAVLYRFTASHTGAWTGNDVTITVVGDDVSKNENCCQWWAGGDNIFNNRPQVSRKGLRHIRDIRIFTNNKNDVFTLSGTFIGELNNYVIHIYANGTDEYSFNVSSTNVPVWSSVEKNGRVVQVLCDTNGLSERSYISYAEHILINHRCIHFYDSTFSELYSSPDSKLVGTRFNNIEHIVKLSKARYDWSFWGTESNPLGWVVGNFISSSGEANAQGFYMRTLNTVDIVHSIPGAKYFTVTAPEGHAIHVCEYNVNDDSWIKTYGINDIRNESATRSVTVNVEYGKNYKFALGRFTNSDSGSYITQEFINSITLDVYYDYDLTDINDYYFPYIDNTVDKINNLTNAISNESFGFIFITDHHYLRNAFQSPKLINYLVKKTGIHTVIFGGDAFQNWKDVNEQNTYVNMVYSMFEHCGETDYFCITGNHEWNDYTGEENSQSAVNAITTNRKRYHVPVMDKYGNYYFDDVVSKTRIFCISTAVSGSIPWTSILWLGNCLLDVPSGYNVMTIAHAGVLNSGGVIIQKNTYANVSKLLGAFDRSENVSLYDSEGVLKGTFNYTSKTGTAICYLCGHTHEDISIEKADDENHVLLVCTAGDLYKDASGNHYTFDDENGQAVIRNVGTIYEQAFDVIQIDPIAKKLYCTRVGAGLDREFSY